MLKAFHSRFVSSFLAILVASNVLSVSGLSFWPIRSKSSQPVVRVPKADRRNYRQRVLDNGLRVLTVHDQDAAKSGFALAVSVGSFTEPSKLPGLAHFCEHLLFLGTEKYPDESSFDEFLAKNDGESNAYTADERTVFYNEVALQALDQGLDRFAQFFIAPLFKDELVARELNAVNSEHTKNMPDQDMRMWETIRGLADPQSVVGRFTCGTKQSLNHGNAETIKALKRYHKSNYCAPRMNLVIVSNHSLDEQMAMARKHFGAVPAQRQGQNQTNLCSPEPRDFSEDPGFKSNSTLGQYIQLKANSVPAMWFMFPMPATIKSYSAQPAAVLEYLLGYQGKRSLRSRLLKAGLISDLYVEVDESSAGTLAFIMFELTHHGCIDQAAVHKTTFAYLAKLQHLRTHDRSKLESIYSTMQQMSAVSFDYQEAENSLMDTVSTLAESSQLYEPEDVLAGAVKIDNNDSDLLAELIGYLRPDNVNVAIASPFFDKSNANARNQYYELDYAVGPVPAWMQKAWESGPEHASEVHFPPELKFVPSDLTVRKVGTQDNTPKLLESRDGMEIWWNGHGQFSVPKEHFQAMFVVPKSLADSAEEDALRQLHVKLTSQALEEPTEDLAYCGLGWGLDSTSEGYTLSVSGYNEHAPDVVKMLAESFAHPLAMQDANFTRAKESLLDDLEDVSDWMPYEHASEVLSSVTTSGVFTSAQVAKAMKDITKERFQQYLRHLNAQGLRLKVLSTGNRNETGAQSLVHILVDGLQLSKELVEKDAAQNRVVQFDQDKEVLVKLANPIPDDPDSAVINAYQFGVPDVADRVLLLMIGQMVAQPVYDTLRTQQQLGYVVDGYMTSRLSTMELRVVVQGDKKDPDVVDRRIEAVLESFGDDLKSLSHDEFLEWKESARAMIAEKDLNPDQEADRLWAGVLNGQCFDFRSKALEFLDELDSPSELAATYRRLREKPRKVSVRLQGQQEHKAHEHKAELKEQRNKGSKMKLLQLASHSVDRRRTKRAHKAVAAKQAVSVRDKFRRRPSAARGKRRVRGAVRKASRKASRRLRRRRGISLASMKAASKRFHMRRHRHRHPRVVLQVKKPSETGIKEEILKNHSFWSNHRICDVHKNHTTAP